MATINLDIGHLFLHEKVRIIRRLRNITSLQFAQMTKLPTLTLFNFENGLYKKPHASVRSAIFKALKLNKHELEKQTTLTIEINNLSELVRVHMIYHNYKSPKILGNEIGVSAYCIQQPNMKTCLKLGIDIDTVLQVFSEQVTSGL